jgi:hypothetical protein
MIPGLFCLVANGCTSPFDNPVEAALDAPNLSTPVRVAEARIKNEWNNSIEPRVAERTTDGGYIIAGSAGFNAGPSITSGIMGPKGWVVKTDQSGRVLWSYYRVMPDLEPATPSAPIHDSVHFSPTYHGALSMPDGSTFLCGQMDYLPHSQADKRGGLLTHLDKKGVLISERLLSPNVGETEGTKGIETLQQCIRWGDGIAVVGCATRYMPGSSGDGPLQLATTFYWVLALDRTGKIRWEKLIPTTHIGTALTDGGLVLQAHGPDLVFSAMDNAESEVVHLSPNGQVAARMSLQGQFRLVRSVVPGNTIQIWGVERHEPRSQVLTLNDRMDEIGRKEGAPYEDCFPSSIYRMPDQSYVLFGSIRHSPSLVIHTAIAHVDGNLRAAELFEPLSGTGTFEDFGRLDAAVPAQDLGTFVVAMSVVTRGLISNDPNKPGVMADFIRGVDFNVVSVDPKNK